MKKTTPELEALLAVEKGEALPAAVVWALVLLATVALGLLH